MGVDEGERVPLVSLRGERDPRASRGVRGAAQMPDVSRAVRGAAQMPDAGHSHTAVCARSGLARRAGAGGGRGARGAAAVRFSSARRGGVRSGRVDTIDVRHTRAKDPIPSDQNTFGLRISLDSPYYAPIERKTNGPTKTPSASPLVSLVSSSQFRWDPRLATWHRPRRFVHTGHSRGHVWLGHVMKRAQGSCAGGGRGVALFLCLRLGR